MKRMAVTAVVASVFLWGIFLGGLSWAEEAKELSSYMPLSDEIVARDKDAKDAVYYSTDVTVMTAKLKEFGVAFPDNMSFPQGGLFILVISDYTGECFTSMSKINSKQTLVVDLAKDKDAKPPAAAAEGKKNSRLILIACSPQQGIKRWAIKTADGKEHEVTGTELKKK